jgi:hypothetical protein
MDRPTLTLRYRLDAEYVTSVLKAANEAITALVSLTEALRLEQSLPALQTKVDQGVDLGLS